ncbi:restriction endonuclease subunit S [Rhodococcus erythropolis]|nr:restriction endonuclease subunit S [Rhodococcus erythropolis]
MNWPAYAEYKETAGSDPVPDHWKISKLRHLLKVNPSVPESLRSDMNEMVTFLPMEAIGEDGILDTTRERPVRELLIGYSYFANGDVIMAKVTPCFENGKAAVIETLPTKDGFGTSEVTTLRPRSDLDQRFLGYFVRSDRFRQSSIAAMTGAGGLKRVPDEHVRSFEIGLPSDAEQYGIAMFLDRETAKIDALISKQEQLITTLREDRAATITHAVTMGLDPEVVTRESDTDWLGAIPAHWQLRPLRFMYSKIKAQNHPSEQLLSIYRDYGVIPKGSRTDNFNKASADLSYYQLVEPGDLVVNRMKAWQGSVGISWHRGIISPDYYVYKPVHDQCNSYLNYLFRCQRYTAGYGRLSTGVRPSQWSITPGDHLGLEALLPPAAEQGAIAEFLDDRCVKIDVLISKSTQMIDTLREYRSALITDAVTGKIDVRGAA